MEEVASETKEKILDYVDDAFSVFKGSVHQFFLYLVSPDFHIKDLE